MRLARYLPVLWLVALPLSLRAQTPDERLRLDSLHRTADAFTDSLALAATERARIAYAREHRDDPFIHMELGWVARRLGDLTGNKQRYDDAAGEFQWASDIKPDWAYAWYWLGVCELDIGEARAPVIENIRQVLGIDFLSQAVRDFARAIAVDPSFVDGLVDLANTTLRQRARGRTAVALQALRNAAATPAARAARVWLARGRLELVAGEPDSAVYALHQFLDRGGDRGVGGVELARAFAFADERDSALLAYHGAIQPPVSDSARAQIRRDVLWIASPAELRAFDALPSDSLARFVTRFWDRRDVEDARRPGERLVEQFRRWVYAMQNFQLLGRHRAHNVDFALHDTTQSELDDRGVIYMRHGPPSDRVTYRPPGTATEPSETWRYRRQPPEQDLVFNFAPMGHVQDYRLLVSLAPACVQGYWVVGQRMVDIRGNPTADFATPGVVDQACFGARAGLSPIYDRLQRVPLNSNSMVEALATERAMMQHDADVGIRTDSYRMTFAGNLLPVITTFVVGDTARHPQLHVVFAVPGERLKPEGGEGGGVVYPLRLRVMVFDSAERRVAEADTVRSFHAARPLAAGSYLAEQMIVDVPPGDWRAHILVAEAAPGGPAQNNGQLVRDWPVVVPRMDSGFASSDLVLGREGSGLVWRRGPLGDVPLNPLGVFPVDSAAVLYYELYGLPQGSSVETHVTMRQEGRSFLSRLFGRGSRVDVAYTTVTDAPLLARVRQRLDLAGMRPGRYSLEVTFTDDATGAKITRDDWIEIVGRAP